MIFNRQTIFFSLLILCFTFSNFLSARALPHWATGQDTVLVEMNDFQITSRDLFERINSLPPQSRPHFRTIEGQKRMLEIMINENTFYQRALELGIDQNRFVQNTIFNNSKTSAVEVYIDEALREELNFNPASIEIYFHENIDFSSPVPRAMLQYIPADRELIEEIDNSFLENPSDMLVIERDGNIRNSEPFTSEARIHFFRKNDFERAITRPFSELRDEIEDDIIRQKEQELYQTHINNLTERYGIVQDYELLKKLGVRAFRLPGLHGGTEHLNVASIMAPEGMADTIAIQSFHPELRLTLGDIEDVFLNAASRDMLLNEFDTPEWRETLLNEEINRRLIDFATEEANIFETRQYRPELRQVRHDTIVNFFKDIEINNNIVITREELFEYYQNNPEGLTIPEERLFRQFVAVEQRTARRHHREISRMFRRNQHDLVPDYITRESLMGHNGGLLDIKYGDIVVPTVGPDEYYSNKIFESEKGQLSQVFKNINDYYVFFFVTEIIPEHKRPFSDVENRFRGIVYRQKAEELTNQKQDELKEFYNVVLHEDRIIGVITASELFLYAEIARRMGRIEDTMLFLDYIINDFEGTEYAYDALFMKGFMASIELNNEDLAIQTFQNIIEKYQEGDLNEAAIFILETLQNNLPLDSVFEE
ncbi:MAG: peptidylprolyl isomerase [Candidatus Cloacimonetes bacterium]|nr:peptidylprolyl isomerase [Candidatus Cloacimonadota bacterium]